MTADIVLLGKQDGVAAVTLNRPDIHNAFDENVIARLSALWDELARDRGVQVVILRGAGKSFSAGGDLNWMKRAAGYTEEQNRADGMKLARMLHGLYALPQLTVAVAHGAAMGGGLGLVACCDIVIAQQDMKFSLSEVRLGLAPATIGPYVLRALGERQSRRYFQTGERFDGRKAYELGLAHILYDTDAERDAALAGIMENVRANGPEAMAASKRLCLDLAGRPLSDELIADTASRIAALRAGDEAREGLAAFLEKRRPRWSRA